MLNATSYPLIYSLSEIVFSIPRNCRNPSTSFAAILFRIKGRKPSSSRLSRGIRGEARRADPRPHPLSGLVSAVDNRVIGVRGFGASLALYGLLFLGMKGSSPRYCHKVLSSDPFSRATFKECSPIPHKNWPVLSRIKRSICIYIWAAVFRDPFLNCLGE